MSEPKRFSAKSQARNLDANLRLLASPPTSSSFKFTSTPQPAFVPPSTRQNMTHKLPPNLLALFSARPALRYLPPSDHAPEERKTNNIGGVAQYLSAIEEYKENVPYQPTESWLQRKDRLKLEKKERQERLATEGLAQSMRVVTF